MLRFQSDVARGFNRRKRYLGRMWQSRYRARIIDSQSCFCQAVSYVHLNPVAAGIADDPAACPHSGHREILGLRPPALIDSTEIRIGFEGDDVREGRRRYLEWVRAVAEARWVQQGIEELPWWEGASDIDEIAAPNTHPTAQTFDGRTLESDRVILELHEFVDLCGTASGHSLCRLSSSSRRPEVIRGRVELAAVAVGRYGFRSREIAALIGKHPSSMSRWLEIAYRSVATDPGFNNRIDGLDRAISSAARSRSQ